MRKTISILLAGLMMTQSVNCVAVEQESPGEDNATPVNIVQTAVSEWLSEYNKTAETEATEINELLQLGTEAVPGIILKYDTSPEYDTTNDRAAYHAIDGENIATAWGDTYRPLNDKNNDLVGRFSLNLQRQYKFNTIIIYEKNADDVSELLNLSVTTADEYAFPADFATGVDTAFDGTSPDDYSRFTTGKKSFATDDIEWTKEADTANKAIKHTIYLPEAEHAQYVSLQFNYAKKTSPGIVEVELYCDEPEELIMVNEASDTTQMQEAIESVYLNSTGEWKTEYESLTDEQKIALADKVLADRPEYGYSSLSNAEKKIDAVINELMAENEEDTATSLNIVQTAVNDYLTAINEDALTEENVYDTYNAEGTLTDNKGLLLKNQTGIDNGAGRFVKSIDGINNSTTNFMRTSTTSTGTGTKFPQIAINLQKVRRFNKIVFYESSKDSAAVSGVTPPTSKITSGIKIAVADSYTDNGVAFAVKTVLDSKAKDTTVFENYDEIEADEYTYTVEPVGDYEDSVLKHTVILNEAQSRQFFILQFSYKKGAATDIMEFELYCEEPDELVAVNAVTENDISAMESAIGRVYEKSTGSWKSEYENLTSEQLTALSAAVLADRPDYGYSSLNAVEKKIQAVIDEQKPIYEKINKAESGADILEVLSAYGERDLSAGAWAKYSALSDGLKDSACGFLYSSKPEEGYASSAALEEKLFEIICDLTAENLVQTAAEEYLEAIGEEALTATNVFGKDATPGILIERETGRLQNSNYMWKDAVDGNYATTAPSRTAVDSSSGAEQTRYCRISLNLQSKRHFNRLVVYDMLSSNKETTFTSDDVSMVISDIYTNDETAYDWTSPGNFVAEFEESALELSKINLNHTCETIDGGFRHTFTFDDLEGQYFSFQVKYMGYIKPVVSELELYYDEPENLAAINGCKTADEVINTIETYKNDLFKPVYSEYSLLSYEGKVEVATELLAAKSQIPGGKFYPESQVHAVLNSLMKIIIVNTAQSASQIVQTIETAQSVAPAELWSEYTVLTDAEKATLCQFVLEERAAQTNQKYADMDAVFATMDKYLGVILASGAGADKVREVLLEYKDVYQLDFTEVNSFSDDEKTAFYDLLDNRTYTSILALQQAFSAAVIDIKNQDNEGGTSGNTGSSTIGSIGNLSGGGGGGGGGGSTKEEKPAQTTPGTNTENETTKPKDVFSDLDTVSWAKDDISYLASKGIVSDEVDTFRPNDSVSREEMIKMMILGFELVNEDAQCSFTDVPKDRWSYIYVASAVQNGICNGISENLFGSSLSLTREDAAVLLDRLITALNMTFEAEETEAFTDADSFSEYSRESIQRIKAYGIMQGRGENNFVPKGIITRAEAAKVIASLHRLWKK